MPDEITISASLRVSKNSALLYDELKRNGITVDMTGNIIEKGVQAIGYVAHELVAINSDIGTRGWAMFLNVGSVGIDMGIQVGTTFVPIWRLESGESAGPFRLQSEDLYAIADASGSNLQKLVLEE